MRGLTIKDGLTSGNGGGIFNSETLVLEDCTITGCLAANGGAITNELGTLSMNRCVISGNTAMVYGGGIDNYAGTASVSDCSIIANSADFGGGIENSTGANLQLARCAIAANSATTSGGGIDCFSSTLSVINTTLTDNAAPYGGGIINESGDVQLLSSTIVDNTSTAPAGGGLLTSSKAPAANTTLHNTIVAGNVGGDIAGDDPAFADPNPTSSHNLISDASTAGGLLDGVSGNIVGQDPALLPLADNGGLTATRAFAPGSPGIDAGDSALVPAGLTTDARGPGFARIVGPSVDIGAYEQEELGAAMQIVAIEFEAAPRRATVHWQSAPGGHYRVLRSTAMQEWKVVADDIPATGALTKFIDTTPPADCACYIIERR